LTHHTCDACREPVADERRTELEITIGACRLVASLYLHEASSGQGRPAHLCVGCFRRVFGSTRNMFGREEIAVPG
jgi:hypothetical protein